MRLVLAALVLAAATGASTSDAEAWRNLRSTASLLEQEDAAGDLVARLLGHRLRHLFDISVLPDLALDNDGKDVVSLHTVTDGDQVVKVRVSANSGLAASWGINHYLKKYWNAHIGWDTQRIVIPKKLPRARFSLRAVDRFRYHQNVCTPGYTFAFWQWSHWEKHIDWMAMNAINLPLAFTAQEAIWNRVYRKLGLSQESLDSHFAGPAFLPWQRMGNMEGWGGPLSPGWHDFSVALQHRILQRMRSLGMTPVLPSFAGHVPQAVTELFPESAFSKLKWSAEFNATFLLEPVDPLFQRIADAFMKEYIAEFGTDHVYNCDTFNEMDPKSNATEYLSAAGAAIFRGMTSVDPKAVWIMQGWLFLSDFWKNDQVEALVTSAPKGSIIVLDLDSTNAEQFTRTGSYFGQPFIFNDLNNFGGNQLLFGRLGIINSRLFSARSMANSTMIGTGFTPEGLSDTYAATDLMTEMAWRRRPVRDVAKWMSAYAARRYGRRSDRAEEAWAILAKGVLNATVWFPIGGTFITSLPKMNMSNYVWYPLEDVANALEILVKEGDELSHEPGFRFDLVDWTRQFLVNLSPKFYLSALAAYTNGDLAGLKKNATLFLTLLEDLERVLATHAHFMLGPWLEKAKALPATSDKETALYEMNARNQVTLWGPDGQILDYAAKQWSGLVADYYLPRWELFYSMLAQSVSDGHDFDQMEFKKRFMSSIGKPFMLRRNRYPTVPLEDATLVVAQVLEKWRHEASLESLHEMNKAHILSSPNFLSWMRNK